MKYTITTLDLSNWHYLVGNQPNNRYAKRRLYNSRCIIMLNYNNVCIDNIIRYDGNHVKSQWNLMYKQQQEDILATGRYCDGSKNNNKFSMAASYTMMWVDNNESSRNICMNERCQQVGNVHPEFTMISNRQATSKFNAYTVHYQKVHCTYQHHSHTIHIIPMWNNSMILDMHP